MLNLHAEARAYYQLCDEARAHGIPTSLDDPASPRTVEGLRELVDATPEQLADEPTIVLRAMLDGETGPITETTRELAEAELAERHANG